MRVTLLLASLCVWQAVARIPLLETVSAGLRNVGSLPPDVAGVVTVISSPGTPSELTKDMLEAPIVLSAEETASGIILHCHGSTLGGTSQDDRTSLALCSVISGAFLVDGVTTGDIQAGLQNSRHARTLTALFRSRIKLAEDDNNRQTLIITLVDASGDDIGTVYEAVEKDVRALYKASAVEKKGAIPFEDAYELKLLPVGSPSEANQVRDYLENCAIWLLLTQR